MAVRSRDCRDPAYSVDEWRSALHEAMEKEASREAKLESVTVGMLDKRKD
jgi:hypothetical protein